MGKDPGSFSCDQLCQKSCSRLAATSQTDTACYFLCKLPQRFFINLFILVYFIWGVGVGLGFWGEYLSSPAPEP